MNEDQLGLLCVYLPSYPPGRNFQVILEAVLKSKSGYVLGQEATQILLESTRKQREDDMWNLETANMDRTRNKMRTYKPKGDESRVPIDMWGRRAWTDKVVGFS